MRQGLAWYNEIDEYAAQWLRNLIAGGHIAPGDVDTRSIVDVRPEDLAGYTQVHFFAGIGGWSLAARIAGWPDDRPLWTGSCPCQPFSAAGKRKGTEDARHLWPEMRRLVAACRPDVVAGEQVASKDGRAWLAGVRDDLEALAHDVWAADLCSAGVGAPHIRQRIWWLAESNSGERDGFADGEGRQRNGSPTGWQQGDSELERRRAARRVAHHHHHHHHHPRLEVGSLQDDGRGAVRLEGPAAGSPGFDVPWSRYDVVHCTDGKARRFEPGSFPLAHGVSNRVGRLRAYGNAINPWLAAEVLAAYLDGDRGLRMTEVSEMPSDTGVFA